jgi:hypothetical protein
VQGLHDDDGWRGGFLPGTRGGVERQEDSMTGPTVKEWRGAIVTLVLFALGIGYTAKVIYGLPELGSLRMFWFVFEVALAGALVGAAGSIYIAARLADAEIRDNLQRAARLAALQEEQPLGGFRRHE